MLTQKGNIVPVLLIVILVLAGVVGYLLYSKGLLKTPTAKPTAKEEVRLNEQYLNPFEKESSYTNPFDEYVNPFDVVGAEGHE